MDEWHVVGHEALTKWTLLEGNRSKKLFCFLIPVQVVYSFTNKRSLTDQNRTHYEEGEFGRYANGDIPLVLRK